MENPTNGDKIEGPMIVGDAFLHTPHLGQAAALYTSEAVRGTLLPATDKEQTKPKDYEVTSNMDNKIEQAIDKFTAWLERQPADETAPVDEFAAVQAERDNLKIELEAIQAAKAKAEKYTAIKAEFDTDQFGAAFAEYATDTDAIEVLADMTDEQREWVIKELRAKSAQINEGALLEEVGADVEGVSDGEPTAQLDAAVKKIMKEENVNYGAALEIAKTKHADLFSAIYK
jgi:hypothetical protein